MGTWKTGTQKFCHLADLPRSYWKPLRFLRALKYLPSMTHLCNHYPQTPRWAVDSSVKHFMVLRSCCCYIIWKPTCLSLWTEEHGWIAWTSHSVLFPFLLLDFFWREHPLVVWWMSIWVASGITYRYIFISCHPLTLHWYGEDIGAPQNDR